MDKMYNWGIIGLGEIAHQFVESAQKNNRTIYGVAARQKERAQEFAKQYGIDHAYPDYQALVADENIDIVYIASINSQHFDLIKLCLTHQKHVLCEKAIWHKLSDLEELEELAQTNGLILAEAMTIYHMPLMNEIKQHVQKGMIGKLQSVQADFGSLKEDDPTNRFFSKEKGGGAMLDIGTYALSFLSYFIEGKVTELSKVQIPYQATGVDERWNVAMVTDAAVLATSTLSFRSKLPKRALVVGDEGYFEIYDYPRAQKASLIKPDGTTTELTVGDSTQALFYEMCAMEEAVGTQNKQKVYFDLTKQTVSWMDVLLQS